LIFRGILLGLVFGVLSACAGGSGRQGTEIVVSAAGPTALVQSGSQAVFVMTVTNSGPYDASGVTLIDNVGNQLKFISITCAAQNGATCPATTGLQMTVPTLPNGGVLVFSVTLELNATATGTVSNSMRASFQGEIDPSGASATAIATAVNTVTDLVVSGTGPTQTLAGGSQAVFVMTVTNKGPQATATFNIYDNLSTGLTLASITCAASGGATCPDTVGVLTPVNALPSGGILTFTVTAQIGQNVNGTVSNGLVANVGTDPNQADNSFYVTANVVTAVLAVSGAPPPGPIADGASATFTVTVTNNGPGTAQNVTIANSLSPGITAGTVTCMASTGAACPGSLGPTMTVASLVSGGVLTFTVPFGVNSGTSGTVSDAVTVSSTTDPKGNHTATLNVQAGNPDNGTYQLFAANGRQYSMVIDFDTGSYTISGNNQTLQQTFTADSSGGGYTVNGVARFRVASNLIAGGQDFGNGVIPYVAASVPGSNVQQLAATYDLVTLDLPTGGPQITYAGTARVSGNTLQVCQSSSGVASPQNCSSLPGGALQSYSLTVSGNIYTATSTGSGPSFEFQAGMAGASAVILSAGTAPDGSQQLLIGIPDSAALAGGTTQGASTSRDWVTMTLTSSSYAYTGELGGADSASLHQINNNVGPFSIVTGNRASDAAQIYVMQAYPLSIAFGATGGAASGLLQVTVP
jgi:uncharacterized repeat protein (TIGR01451 family)